MPPRQQKILLKNALRKDLRCEADPKSVPLLQSFFKTGPGEYGEGDLVA